VGGGLSSPTPLAEAAGCDLSVFASGEPGLDDWLRHRARSGEGRHARTYVVLSGTRVVAYYCLSAGSVPLADLPSAKYRRNAPDPVPVLVLGRMAVDMGFQGRGLGSDLLRHCLRQFLAAASIVGVRALVVHPLNERVGQFYKALGFLTMAGADPAMFMPTETAERAFASEV
jgi:ribosomal protein S18 acetylase RimI-like enzyme